MSDKISSNLDTLETTVRTAPPESYRSYCIQNCEAEYDATLQAYRETDLTDGTERAWSLESCRTGAWFARNRTSGKIKILSSSCKLRWCPMCSATRRWFLTQQVSDWLSTAEQPKFLTLTIAHSNKPLNEQLQFLYDSFRKYRKLNLLKRYVRGGVWFFQIHQAKSDDLWHPHLHCVIDSPWIDKYELSAAWEMVTKTSKIINIKEVKDAESMSEYVARYAARPSILTNLSHWSRIELISSLHGRRLVGTWGNARSISLRPSKPPDAADWENVGWYHQVIYNLDTDEKARTIWECYKTDTPCPVGFNLLDKEPTPWQLELITPKTVEESYQQLLDFM